MARAILERMFDPQRLDQLFEQNAHKQYTRDLFFSAVVELMAAVVLCVSPSVYAAYRARKGVLKVCDQAVYDKLKGMELGLSAALVRDAAQQVIPLLNELGQRRAAWLPTYRSRILDGNFLGATEHRIEELRTTWAAALPGKVLTVLDQETELAEEVFLTPDGHAQERSLLDDVLVKVAARDLWIADRNFCTLKFLSGIAARCGFFVIRQHGQVKGKLRGQRRKVGVGPSGRVVEQAIELTYEGQLHRWRRITIYLNEPTRDGDRELHLLTNLPEEVSALKVAELYGKRWTIETLFYHVTMTLQCEINTLGYPPAALFVFCLALVLANAVTLLKAALRAAHGAEAVDELSGYYLALEIEKTHEGMMVAIPPPEWRRFRRMAAAKFATVLTHLARHADLERYQKHVRGPKKKPPPRTAYKNGSHVSTHKLLATRRR